MGWKPASSLASGKNRYDPGRLVRLPPLLLGGSPELCQVDTRHKAWAGSATGLDKVQTAYSRFDSYPSHLGNPACRSEGVTQVAEYIPVKEAARHYGCDGSALRERIKDGSLEGVLHRTAYYVKLPLPPREALNLRSSPKAVKKLRLPDQVVETPPAPEPTPAPTLAQLDEWVMHRELLLALVETQRETNQLLGELLEEWRNSSPRRNGVA